MKINIISDIHADANRETGEVFYNLPPQHSLKKCTKLFNILYSDWTESEELHELIRFNYDVDSISELKVLNSVDDITAFFEDFKKDFETRFVNTTIDKSVYYIRAINNLDFLYQQISHNPMYRRTNLRYDDLINHMYKCIYTFDPSKLEPADYLIIAGDLGLDNTYDAILADITEKTKGKFKKILHIAGNHDHWWCGHGINGATRPEDVNFEHDYCEFTDGEYVFLGCTMWTPIPEDHVWRVGRYMNDYVYTPGRFNCYRSSKQYEIQSTWLRNKINANKDKKVIVFTHHQPFKELTHDDYKHNGLGWDGKDVNAAYVVLDHSLDDINEHGNIKLWCCGHTHMNYDGMLHNVHVVRNPIGYRDLYGFGVAENNSGTWYNKIIEV